MLLRQHTWPSCHSCKPRSPDTWSSTRCQKIWKLSSLKILLKFTIQNLCCKVTWVRFGLEFNIFLTGSNTYRSQTFNKNVRVGKSSAHYTWVCWRWPRQLGWEVCNTRLDGACLESGNNTFWILGFRLRLSYHTGTQIQFHKSVNHYSKFTFPKIVLFKYIFWESWWYSCQTLEGTPTTQV